MFRSVSFAQRFSQYSSVDLDSAESELDDPGFSYEDEVVSLFYNSMLDIIVDEWTVVEDKEKKSKPETDLTDEIRDIKEISATDWKNLSQSVITPSRISITKRSKRASQMSSTSDTSKLSISKKRKKLSTVKVAKKLRSDSSRVSTLSEGVRKIEIVDSRVNMAQMRASPIMLDSTVPQKSSKPDWIIDAEPENVIIKFKNGNVYRGRVVKKRLDGEGEFTWSNGVVYSGEFKSGDLTGRGTIIYTDRSYCHADFCKGLLHGEGTAYITTTNNLYSGHWRKGKKCGKGWILYDTKSWYDGEWLDGIRHGKGLRQYNQSSRYQGNWLNGQRHGQGTMVWDNKDYYSGEWKNGVMDGYGAYVWKGSFNKEFIYPLQNTYEGYWLNGMRSGMGVMQFGFQNGARMAGQWIRNLKHGPGIIVCGNGKIIKGNTLFMYDKPVDLQLFNSGRSLASIIDIKRNLSNKRVDADGTDPITEDKLCPEHEQDLNRMSMFNEIPITYSSQINPLRIPVHAELNLIDLKYYLKLVGEKYGFFDSLEGGGTNSSRELDIDTRLKRNNILEFEEKMLRHAITYHYLLLRNVYQLYATVATTERVFVRVLLIRMFIRQMYLDSGVTEKLSLIEIELNVLENPDCGLENEHNPFEKIYFWQFIYSLMSTAWKLYSDNSEEYKKKGILATLFKKFLMEYIHPSVCNIKSSALREYINLMPVNNVYLLYRSIGEPHTVRKFFCACLNKFESTCDALFQDNEIKHLKQGANIVMFDRLLYICEDLEIGQKPDEPTPYPLPDTVYKNFRVFRKLKARQLMKCFAKVCPRIVEEDVIVDMDYGLSFLEFYNILITASIKVIEMAKKSEERAKESRLTDASLLSSSRRSSKRSSLKKNRK